MGAHNKSIFQDFDRFLRTEIDLVEDDVRLVLDESSSNFITYEIKPGIYIFRDLSEVLTKNSQLGFDGFSNSNNIDRKNTTMKTKLIVRPDKIAIRFDEKAFFSSVFGFIPHWDSKHYNEYISQKIDKLKYNKLNQLKCDVIDGSVGNGI